MLPSILRCIHPKFRSNVLPQSSGSKCKPCVEPTQNIINRFNNVRRPHSTVCLILSACFFGLLVNMEDEDKNFLRKRRKVFTRMHSITSQNIAGNHLDHRCEGLLSDMLQRPTVNMINYSA